MSQTNPAGGPWQQLSNYQENLRVAVQESNALRTENARLRASLGTIAGAEPNGYDAAMLRGIARSALSD